jgi:branched-chain amino acid transport system ATP-binding protein
LGRIFSQLAEEGMAVLVIEHNTRFVSEICREVHVLDSGRLIAHGTPQEVMRDAAVVAAYLGD